jgi:hypothetical protein
MEERGQGDGCKKVPFQGVDMFSKSNLFGNNGMSENVQFHKPLDSAFEINRLKQENAILKDQVFQNLLRS